MVDHYEKLDNPVLIAKQIVSGKIKPEQGCHMLATICQNTNYTDSLLTFEHLDHLRTEHDHLGFSAESIKGDIIEEAKNLIALENS